ncbi:hypothetical protein SDC9_117380 [bioreactor metagenome]|uniref:Uncharacterized protein n=1 Tax=bioreactor metagenome TaxID=1076179 RepID=A0A645BYU5_9ZZZZ
MFPDGDDKARNRVRAAEPADGVALVQVGALRTHHHVIDVEEIEQDPAKCDRRFRRGDRTGEKRAKFINRSTGVLEQLALLVGQPLQSLLDALLVLFGHSIALTTLPGQHPACVERKANHLAKGGEAEVHRRCRHGKRRRP